MRFAQFLDPIFGIERMHLQRGRVNQKTRPDKSIVHLMIAQDVADVLAKKAFDAFPKFLHAIDVLLLHPPGPVRRIGRARFECLDLLLDLEIPRDIGDQILHEWESLHRLDRDRLVERQIAHARHAHQLRHAVDFRRTRAALARLAVPAASQIVRLRPPECRCTASSTTMPSETLGRVIAKFAAVRVAAPDFEMSRALFVDSFHFLNHLLQLLRHFGNRFAAESASHRLGPSE